MYFDDSIPSLFKKDLHRYQLQNTSAISALTQVGTQLSLEGKGLSAENAGLLSSVLAAAGGLFGPKGVPELVEGAHSLVGANRAVIDPRKLTDYALNPDRPVGGNKARVFESVLGFTKGNSDLLMKQLQEGVMKNTPIPGKVDQYGARFTVDIPVAGPNGSAVVRSGWIYKPGSNTPELTTIFVK
jgi:filamentous hemagglutinin